LPKSSTKDMARRVDFYGGPDGPTGKLQMPDPATIASAIALFKSAVDSIRSAISLVKDVNALGGGSEQQQKATPVRTRQLPKPKWLKPSDTSCVSASRYPPRCERSDTSTGGRGNITKAIPSTSAQNAGTTRRVHTTTSGLRPRDRPTNRAAWGNCSSDLLSIRAKPGQYIF